MIKCITFDLDDTLWKIEPVITRAEIFFQKWLDSNYPTVSEKFNIELLRKLMKQTSLENPDIKHDLTKIRIKAYSHLMNLYNLPDDMPLKAFNYFMEYRNNVTLFNDVENTLEELKKKYLLGTITNGNASLKKIGIDKYFDFEIKASEIGHMKPKPEIFVAALSAANCKPEEMIHIGDSYDKDVMGAKSVNINYIWINHDDIIENDANEKYTVRNFSEIEKILDKIG